MSKFRKAKGIPWAVLRLRQFFCWPVPNTLYLAWDGTIYFLSVTHPPTLAGYVEDHENEHLRQQAEHGKWRFLWRYCTSQKWRAKFEAEAFAAGEITAGLITPRKAAGKICNDYFLSLPPLTVLGYIDERFKGENHNGSDTQPQEEIPSSGENS